jgi:hypothetical protein
VSAAVQHRQATTDDPRYFATAEMAQKFNDLGMGHVPHDLATSGYAVVRNPAPIEVMQRIRSAIMRLATPGGPVNVQESSPLLLGRDPVFEEAVLNPSVLAIVEATCGKGALLSQLLGTVRRAGPETAGLHADQSWMPDPFPVQSLSVTICWTCDEYSRESGATKVIPRSHLLRRFPTDEERASEPGAVPIECPPNSLAIWLGETWHGSYPRLVEQGERVVLHLTYSRISLRPVEDYSHLDEAWLEGKPMALRELLGREDFLEKPNTERMGGQYLTRVRRTQNLGRQNTFYVHPQPQ